MSKEIEPVHIDQSGNKYYFGSAEQPFNFHPNPTSPMRSREAEKAIREGGAVIRLPKSMSDRVGGLVVREYIETHNRTIRESMSE